MPIGHPTFRKKYPDECQLAESLGNKWNPDYLGRFPWEITSTASKKKLGELIYNLHCKGGCLGESFTLYQFNEETARGNTIWFIVWVKPQYIKELDPNFKLCAIPKVNHC